MDDFLRIEKLLTNLADEPEQGGKYYQLAGKLEMILKNTNTSAAEKAREIADFIEHGVK